LHIKISTLAHRHISTLKALLLCAALTTITSCKWLGKPERKTFTETYSSGIFNEANSIIPTKDGGYLLAGYTIEKDDPNVPNAPYTLYLVKIDESGYKLWEKKWKFSDFDEAMDIKRTTDGNFIISGQTKNGNGNMDVLLMKINDNGDSLWTKTLGTEMDESGNSIVPVADGGYMIAGVTGVFQPGDSNAQQNIYLARTDAKGDLQWSKAFGDTGQNYAMDVKAVKGGYIIAGTTNSTGAGKEDMFLMRTDEKGDTLWSATYGSTEPDFGVSVLPVADGYILAGTTKDTTGNQDIMLVKTDSVGNIVWAKTFGSKDPEEFGSLTAVPEGGYIMAGSTFNSATGGNKFYLLRINEKGDSLWTRSYPAAKNETAHSVAVTPDKGFIIAGVRDGDNSSYMYVMKVDEHGNLGK